MLQDPHFRATRVKSDFDKTSCPLIQPEALSVQYPSHAHSRFQTKVNIMSCRQLPLTYFNSAIGTNPVSPLEKFRL